MVSSPQKTLFSLFMVKLFVTLAEASEEFKDVFVSLQLQLSKEKCVDYSIFITEKKNPKWR